MVEQEPATEGTEAVAHEAQTIQFKEVQDIARRVGQSMSGKSESEVLEWLDAGDTPPDRPAARPAGLPAGAGPENPVDIEDASASAEAAEKAKAALAAAGEAPAEGEPAETAPKAEEPATDPADESAYEAALRALRRAKTPTAVIRGMPREQVVAWGLELAKVQAGADQAFTRLRELESSERPQENPSGQATPPAATADATDAADLAELSEALGLDKEGGAVLAKALQARDARVQAELTRRDQRDQVRDAALANLVLESARNELRDRFPSLADRSKFNDVKEKARQLYRGGGYETAVDAMEDAAALILKDDVKAASDKTALAKARGRTTPPTARQPAKTQSHEDRLGATLAALDSGATREQAAAAGGW